MVNPPRRLFIALPVDDEIALMLLKTGIVFLDKFSQILKIVHQENFHITVKFFGAVDADKADKLFADFKLLAGLKKISYTIGDIGAFPSADHPSVIWAGIKYDEIPMIEIVQSVEQLASAHGFPPEKKNFSPHLTLARVRREKKIPHELKKFISQEHKDISGSSVFKELVLFESVLKKTGPEYKKISVIKLI